MSRHNQRHRPPVSLPAATLQSSPTVRSSMNFSFAPPLFNGRDSCFSRFVSDFKIFATLHSWSESEQLMYLPLCLTGLARDAFESLEHSQRQSLSVAVEALRQCFAPQGIVEAHAKLQGLSFDPCEPVEVDVTCHVTVISSLLTDSAEPIALPGDASPPERGPPQSCRARRLPGREP